MILDFVDSMIPGLSGTLRIFVSVIAFPFISLIFAQLLGFISRAGSGPR
jgi:hypothetical protein